MQELAGALQSAHPKIQRMCEEESDDAEAVAKLLEINDSIHRTVERYKLMKAGNLEAANSIPKGTLGTTTGVGRNANNQLSLIDFEPDESQATTETTAVSNGPGPHTSVEDDLLSLSLGSNPQTSGGGISLGGATLLELYAQSASPAPSSAPAQHLPSSSPFPSMVSSTQATTSSKTNYDPFASLSTPPVSSKPTTPAPAQHHQTRPSQSLDPFAALVSSGSRPSTPSQQQNGLRAASTTPQPGNSANFGTTTHPAPLIASADDEWNFSSALPPESTLTSTLPQTSTIVVHQSSLKVEFEARRPSTSSMDGPIYIQAYFSNSTPMPIGGIHFQVAVEKSYALRLQPQSGRDLSPNTSRGVKQEILLTNVPLGKGNSVKMRFKIGYTMNGQSKEEQGMVPSLGIS